jgi:signal transduction histidine kinase
LAKVIRKYIPWRIQWRGVLLESVGFIAVYLVWALLRSPQSAGRLLIGSVAVLTPGITAAILIFIHFPNLPPASRNAWRLLGIGLSCWSLGFAIRTYYEGLRGVPAPILSAADFSIVLFYPLLFAGLILFPFESPYAPSRFRFLLDAIISSGVAAGLGWLILGRSTATWGLNQIAPTIYPIADLILLMLLFNVILANQKARRVLFVWGGGLLLFLFSDYIYSLLAPVNGYQVGGFEGVGWMAGNLLFGVGAVFLAERRAKVTEAIDHEPYDWGNRIQNILPITLVLVLIWFVLSDWRLRGRLSIVGAGMALILGLILVVRMGVRAGEVELHRYWQLVSNIAEPTFICNPSGKILLANPAFVKASGQQNENQLINRDLTSVFDLDVFPTDLLDRKAGPNWSRECLLALTKTPFLLTLSPIYSEGRKVLLAGAAHDLSDQKRQQLAIQNAYDQLHVVYKQLEQLNSQLEEKVQERTATLSEAYRRLEEQNKILQGLDQLKSDFVSMVSHELRTPLTSLNGGLELLLKQPKRPSAERKPLILMKNEVQRLTRFVENILNLSAIDAGRIRVRIMPVAVNGLFEKVNQQFAGIPGSKRIVTCVPGKIPLLKGDESLLQSVLGHLVDNALKYAQDGPIVLDAEQRRSTVRIRVTDSGSGIPMEKRRLLFQRFQRLDVKDSQSVYGYGLGLYLSRRMLQAMKSDLLYESPPEGGSRFYFELKVVR